VIQPHKPHIDAGRFEQAQLVCVGRLAIDAQQATDPKPQPRRCQRAVGRRAAKSPATLIVRDQISRRSTYYHNVKPTARAVG
jgi:hypothetical protein